MTSKSDGTCVRRTVTRTVRDHAVKNRAELDGRLHGPKLGTHRATTLPPEVADGAKIPRTQIPNPCFR